MSKLILVVLACVVVSVLSLPNIVNPLLGLQNIGNRLIESEALVKKEVLQGVTGGGYLSEYPRGYLSGYPSLPGYGNPYQSRIYRQTLYAHAPAAKEENVAYNPSHPSEAKVEQGLADSKPQQMF